MGLTEGSLIGGLLELLEQYELDRRDFVIFGSGPLLAHGLRDEIEDLDVVARGEVWGRVVEVGERGAGEVNGARLAMFRDGRIQFSEGWISKDWDADDLINRAEMIEGLPFAPLADVLKYKLELRRPKDRSDIEALESLLHRAATRGTVAVAELSPGVTP
jgi:hypothetical protein